MTTALEPPSIVKNPERRGSQDYDFLRERGLEHIRRLSGKIWSDHNVHDPGVTALELLCYALTDLGYRTDFETADLLARPDESVDPPALSGFFPAHEVLPNAPLTIADYRRLLLKIEGVRNAWLDPMNDPAQEPAGNYRESEVPIYADCLADRLSYEATNVEGEDNHRVRLSGLYRVLLELEVDDALGSLNETALDYTVRRGPLKGVILSLDSDDPAFVAGGVDFSLDLAAVDDVVSLDHVESIALGGDRDRFEAELSVSLEDGSVVSLPALDLVVLDDKPRAADDPIEIKKTDVSTVLADGKADALVALFWKKQQRRQRSLAAVRCVLDANRGLCEDFLSVDTITADNLAICADVELRSDADIEAVHAQIVHAIEQYLNPPIRYYGLAELLEEGLCADEIFNGPFVDYRFRCGGDEVFTKPGFIKQADLEASELRQTVYVSDLVNLIMDIEGVVTIKNVLLQRYDETGAVGPSQKWCLHVTPTRQPVLDLPNSKLLYFKNGIPYVARRRELAQTLEQLRAEARKAAYVDAEERLERPRGRYRDLARHYSIQHDWPETYGIGVAGLPATASEARVAQAKQLKAYLTFFDQVLADYLAQLAGVRRLLTLDPDLKQTYFTTYLDDLEAAATASYEPQARIAGVRGAFSDEFYVKDPGGDPELADDALRTGLTENEETFLDRRNRLLDHLTARFAEQFNDYVMMMFTLDGDPLRTREDVIADKIDFLREYPILSRDRNRAFNYRPQRPADRWDTDNVAGLQKRVSRLAGIDDFTRRSLTCAALLDALFSTRTIGNDVRLEIKDDATKVMFKSAELFADVDTAFAAAGQIYASMRSEESYAVDASSGVGQVTWSVTGGGTTLQHDEQFDTEADAIQSIRAVLARYDELLADPGAPPGEDPKARCEDEGFHLIEHILLRPYTTEDELIGVCLGPDCTMCGEEDPYSFRITVVLPYWPRRFRSRRFRAFFERLLREETPAHIHARICWISNEQMAQLDGAYRRWVSARAREDFDQALLTQRARTLIRLLGELKTVYPAAELHDCLEGDDENVVRLGSTNLGIF